MRPLKQFLPKGTDPDSKVLGRLLLKPFLIYRVGVPRFHMFHDSGERFFIVKTVVCPSGSHRGADLLQFFQPPAELLCQAATAPRSSAI